MDTFQQNIWFHKPLPSDASSAVRHRPQHHSCWGLWWWRLCDVTRSLGRPWINGVPQCKRGMQRSLGIPDSTCPNRSDWAGSDGAACSPGVFGIPGTWVTEREGRERQKECACGGCWCVKVSVGSCEIDCAFLVCSSQLSFMSACLHWLSMEREQGDRDRSPRRPLNDGLLWWEHIHWADSRICPHAQPWVY